MLIFKNGEEKPAISISICRKIQHYIIRLFISTWKITIKSRNNQHTSVENKLCQTNLISFPDEIPGPLRTETKQQFAHIFILVWFQPQFFLWHLHKASKDTEPARVCYRGCGQAAGNHPAVSNISLPKGQDAVKEAPQGSAPLQVCSIFQ